MGHEQCIVQTVKATPLHISVRSRLTPLKSSLPLWLQTDRINNRRLTRLARALALHHSRRLISPCGSCTKEKNDQKEVRWDARTIANTAHRNGGVQAEAGVEAAADGGNCRSDRTWPAGREGQVVTPTYHARRQGCCQSCISRTISSINVVVISQIDFCSELSYHTHALAA